MSRGILRGPDQSSLELPTSSAEIIPSSVVYVQSEAHEDTSKEDILAVFPAELLSFLLTLKFKDDTEVVDLKSPDHEVIYYLKCMLDDKGEVLFRQFLTSVSYGDRYDLLFNHPEYNTAKFSLINELETKNIPFEIGEGMYQCPNCKGNKTISSSKQTRSADEGERVRVECTQCGFSWRFNS